MTKHKVFISYHHKNDQWAKEALLELDIFIDGSVDTGDINDSLPQETIREIIRDNYLKDTTVTILLVGTDTKNRKHIDWEIYSSMYNGKINKKSGILVIQLPSTKPKYKFISHGEKEKQGLYQNKTFLKNISSRKEFEDYFPYLPKRIIDNLLKPEVKISVVEWDELIIDKNKLKWFIELTFNGKADCEYDLGREMKERNS
ncbi:MULTISPECIES: TIR domain-containing protein [Snodgrassella]|uniref:TIR domain-containing protein n=1 Tax=Snodgrassella TaxID=1193515 RepID=UPI000C1F1FA8|nr:MULTISPECIES: TIR domain-containing protein [Snodgrassella]MBI0132380.1 TIR domain-containing protein [Snodgrassella sp. W8132]PIT67376.1 hypothetical protein BHC52_04720 [Snodgrassella alvi]